ncbi:MAG: glycine oxidase ThiO [Phycisphaerales bacterium]|nr:glycine oxidase ThiO [Phycisphaerales bacterium]
MSIRADAIVIGGGVVGLATALALRQAGLNVVIVERGVCGGEASWAGAGILSPANPHRHDLVQELQTAALDRYPAYCQSLTDATGVDPEYERCGWLDLLTTDQEVRMAQSDVRAAADQQTPDGQPIYEMLTPDEAVALEPNLSRNCLAVLHCRRTGQVRSPRLLQALRIACERADVGIREQTEVAEIELAGQTVAGVRTTDDVRIAAERIVICAGAWSARIGPTTIGQLLPVMPVKGQIVLAQCPARPIQRIINRGKGYLVPRRDGHVIIGATDEPDAGFDKRNTARGINRLIDDAVTMVPSLADAPVVATWAGLRPGSPDGRPYIGPVPEFENLFAATGHFKNGLTLAPITAEIIRDLIVTGQCAFDLSRCAPGRPAKLDRSNRGT